MKTNLNPPSTMSPQAPSTSAPSAIESLRKFHPTPPDQIAVGRAPIRFLELLPDSQRHIRSLGHRNLNLGVRWTRSEVRKLCLDANVTPEAKYACIAAWGGQHEKHFKSSIRANHLVLLIKRLLNSSDTRTDDFKRAQQACEQIKGLKISFYTKLLFFLRPKQDGYILDQWTAKSINCLASSPVIRLTRPNDKGECRAVDDTSPDEYEKFCQAVEGLPAQLWPKLTPPATAEAAEMAIFDKPKGKWRKFVKTWFQAWNFNSLPQTPRRRRSPRIGVASAASATASAGVCSLSLGASATKPIIRLKEGPRAYVKIVNACGDRSDGMLCLHKHPHLWLKNQNASPRYLIGEMLEAGGNFTAESNYTDAPGGVPNCGVGGSNYQGGVRFDSDVDAVRYMKRFFSVMACPGNQQFNQAWVDNC